MLTKILNIGITDQVPITERKYIQVTNSACFLAALMTIAYWPAALFTHNVIVISCYFIAPFLYLIFLKFNQRCQYAKARHGVTLLTLLWISSMMPIFGDQWLVYIWFYPMIAAIPMLFSAKESHWFWFYEILCITMFLVVYSLVDSIEPIYLMKTNFDAIIGYTAPIAAAICTVIVVFFLRYFILNGDKRFIIEHERAEDLLLNILPVNIADRLKDGEVRIADHYANVSVMFIDIAGFTTFARDHSPEEVVVLLNTLFTKFDEMAEKYEVEKIKTIGDAYMVASGLPKKNDSHAINLAKMALEIVQWLESSAMKQQNIQVRIGINTGPVIAGVVGLKKFIYDLWGDTVNLASRMESHGEVERIQISEQTYQHIKDKFETKYRGEITIKGKGLHKTWWLLAINHEN